MVITIVIVSIAFLWLMIETKWLTVRLPQYYREVNKAMEVLLLNLGWWRKWGWYNNSRGGVQ